MTKRRGLGRGLDALLGKEREPSKPAAEDRAEPITGIVQVAVEQLEPNRFQPRMDFDAARLDDLAESIRAQGVVQPIVVTPTADGRYTIVAGERRWRASQQAGLQHVPVVVREIADDRQLLEMALVENLQRADLNAIEEAEAYKTLGESFGLSQEEIAKRVGKGRTTVTNALRLLRLPRVVQDLLRSGQLTAGQARPLLAMPSEARQIELAQETVEHGLTAREIEARAAEAKGGGKESAKKQASTSEPDVHTRAAIDALTQTLQTKVDITRRRRGGGILKLHFHSEEELIRLYDRLMESKS